MPSLGSQMRKTWFDSLYYMVTGRRSFGVWSQRKVHGGLDENKTKTFLRPSSLRWLLLSCKSILTVCFAIFRIQISLWTLKEGRLVPRLQQPKRNKIAISISCASCGTQRRCSLATGVGWRLQTLHLYGRHCLWLKVWRLKPMRGIKNTGAKAGGFEALL